MQIRHVLLTALLAVGLSVPGTAATAHSENGRHHSGYKHSAFYDKWNGGAERHERVWKHKHHERHDHRGWKNHGQQEDAPAEEPEVFTPDPNLEPIEPETEPVAPAPEPETDPELVPVVDPAPAPAPAPGEGTTDGSGGPLTDRLSVPFTAAGYTSSYHIYAEGLDWSQPVGLLMYGDGSGGWGIDNPNSPYLLGGPEGLVAVAKQHNLLLVVPEAPAPDCGSDNCWYDSTHAAGKAGWADVLMSTIKAQYPIDQDRIAIGGYSSGAQWATRYFLPAHGEEQSVDLVVVIGGGGTPISSAQFSAGYAASTVIVHDTGTADRSSSYDAYADAQRGEAWYRTNGFVTDPIWPSGVTHDRGEEFGSILDREIAEHLG